MNEIKYINFEIDVKECKILQETVDSDNPIGIIKGYASTFGNKDRGDDIVAVGAFDRTLMEHRERGNRPIRLFDNHRGNKRLGGIRLENAKVDSVGLFIEAELLLGVREAKEAYIMAKAGFLTDFSIGYGVRKSSRDDETGIRTLHDLELFEVSLVNEPMNMSARVTEVKSDYKNLPLADRDHPWDAAGAKKRVAEKSGSDGPVASGTYKIGFFWSDGAKADEFSSYKLPFVDVIDGEYKAVPKGVFAASSAMRGARGGIDLPSSDKAGVICNIEKYYSTMGLDSPFEGSASFRNEDVELVETISDAEQMLKDAGFTSNARRQFIGKIKGFKSESRDGDEDHGTKQTSVVDAAEVSAVLDSISELKNLLTPKEDTDNGGPRDQPRE